METRFTAAMALVLRVTVTPPMEATAPLRHGMEILSTAATVPLRHVMVTPPTAATVLLRHVMEILSTAAMAPLRHVMVTLFIATGLNSLHCFYIWVAYQGKDYGDPWPLELR